MSHDTALSLIFGVPPPRASWSTDTILLTIMLIVALAAAAGLVTDLLVRKLLTRRHLSR